MVKETKFTSDEKVTVYTGDGEDIFCVNFKSLPEFYEKELSGVKPYTVRLFDNSNGRDIREEFLTNKTANRIRIINTDTRMSFVSKIKDMTIYKGMYMITFDYING